MSSQLWVLNISWTEFLQFDDRFILISPFQNGKDLNGLPKIA
jgi:hypothetical protein